MAKSIQISEKLTEYLPVAIIIMVAAAVLTVNISHWSFWFDESFTSALIKYDYSEIASRTANDVHPPLYYYMLKFWSGMFGATDAALRAMSAVFMLIGGFGVYELVKRMANRYVGYAALVFVFMGPFVVRYGQEARMYAMAATFAVFASLVLYTQMNRTKKKRSLILWLAYALLIAASLYTHYFTFPIIIAHWLYVFYQATKLEVNRKFTRGKLWAAFKKIDPNWWKSNVMAALLFLPWLPTFIDQATRVNSGFWIEKVRHTSATDTATQLFMYENFPASQGPARVVFGIAVIVWIAVGLAVLWRKVERSEKANAIMLVGPATLSMIVLGLYSIPPFTSSIYSVRYLASFSILLYAGVAYLGWLIWRHVSKKVAVGLLLTVAAIMIGGTTQVVWGWGRDHFKANEGMAVLNSVLREGDAIVAQGYWHQYDAYHYINPDFIVQTKVEGNFYGGETLLIGRDEILIENYEDDVYSSTGTIWYISGADDDFSQLPDSWTPIEQLYFENDFKITRMTNQR